MTLVEFLRARLDEDLRAAEMAAGPVGHDWYWDKGVRPIGRRPLMYGRDGVPDGELRMTLEDRQCGDHIARHDPARVLAEVEVKRRIVELHEPTTLHRDGGAGYYDTVLVCRTCGGTDAHFADGTPAPGRPALHPCPTLRLLALPHGDHPDYRDEWRP